MSIQWFPGHMHKTKKALIERLKSTDMVIEMLDARLPASSPNPLLAQLSLGKPKLYLLNKQDLADPGLTRVWLAELQNRPNTSALALDASERQAAQKITAACRALVPHRQGIDRPLRVLICGIPNVGKSTLINGMIGKKSAKTGNEPGITKTEQRLLLADDFWLYDTPGMLWAAMRWTKKPSPSSCSTICASTTCPNCKHVTKPTRKRAKAGKTPTGSNGSAAGAAPCLAAAASTTKKPPKTPSPISATAKSAASPSKPPSNGKPGSPPPAKKKPACKPNAPSSRLNGVRENR